MAGWTGVPEIAVTATGALTEWLSASDSLTGYAAVQLESTAFSGTIQCQASANAGVNSVALQIVNLNDGTTGTGITADGYYRADVGGVARYRWYCSAFTSATAAYIYPTVREG